MKVEIFEFKVFGVPYIKFRNLNSFEDFNLIVKIIENKIKAKVIKKFQGINSIIKTYKKRDFEFDLKIDEDLTILLKPKITHDQTLDKENIKSLRTIANKVINHLSLIPPKAEFRINKYITLQLRDKITEIFVEEKLFNQCFGLYLMIHKYNQDHWDIESIDEAYQNFNIGQYGINLDDIKLSPEDEFWGHCSNLQAWVENDYDTRLIHYNLAFPLLKRLTEVGDPLAKKVFKEEIAKRYKSGFPSVVKYLEEEGYLEYLSKEELEALK